MKPRDVATLFAHLDAKKREIIARLSEAEVARLLIVLAAWEESDDVPVFMRTARRGFFKSGAGVEWMTKRKRRPG
jgi:hypothetical protein